MKNMFKLTVYGLSVAAALGTISPSHAESLNDAVEHALQFNPDVLYQNAKKLSSEQGVREARGAFFPTIDLTAGVGREKTRSPTTAAINPGDPNSVVLDRRESYLELKQNLYAGGAIVGEIERNENLYNAEVLKMFGVADDTALLVVESYLNVLKGRQLVAIARQNLRRHNELMAMINSRNEAGLERDAEVEQTKGRVSLAKANLISEEANLRESKINFLRVVGEPAQNLEWPKVPSYKDLPPSIDNAVDYALLNHPTLKSAYADVEEAKSQHKVANATNYPRVDLVLYAGRDEDIDGLIGLNQSTGAMVRMSYNLFRGGSDLANQRKTAYQVQEAYEVKNRTTEQVKESMRLSWNALVTAQSRLSHLRNYRDASSKTLAAYHEQFKLAKRTLLDLLDSTNENYQAQLNYVDGIYKEIFARYRVLNSAGRLVPYLAAYVPVDVHNTDFMTSHEFFNHNGIATPMSRDMHRIEGNVPQADVQKSHIVISSAGTKVNDLMQLVEHHGNAVLAAPVGSKAAEIVVADKRNNKQPQTNAAPGEKSSIVSSNFASLLDSKALAMLASSELESVARGHSDPQA